MEVKMALGRRIVADFHSEAEAVAAAEAFNREVRQGLEPADTETVDLPAEARTEKGIRVDKLIAKIGLADSVSDAVSQDQGQRGGNQRRDLRKIVFCLTRPVCSSFGSARNGSASGLVSVFWTRGIDL